jgi:hypothetical protein
MGWLRALREPGESYKQIGIIYRSGGRAALI